MGLANTVAGAFKTIQKAINSIPYHADHAVAVYVAAGTYAEDVKISDFNGSTEIYVYGGTTLALAANYIVNSFRVYGCTNQIVIQGFTATTTTKQAFNFINCNFCQLWNSRSVVSATTKMIGVEAANGANVRVTGSEFSNKSSAIYSTQCSTIVSESITGTGNVTGLAAADGGLIRKSGLQASASTAEYCNDGGIITAGVLNPWGDNNTQTRTGVGGGSVLAQSMAPFTKTKLLYNTEYFDYLGEWIPETGSFTPKQSGIYTFDVVCTLVNVPSDTWASLYMYKNGNEDQCLSRNQASSPMDMIISGHVTTDLIAGQPIHIYLYHTYSSAISATGSNMANWFRVSRVS